MNPAAKRVARVKRINHVAIGLLFLIGLVLFGWLVFGYLGHLDGLFTALPWAML